MVLNIKNSEADRLARELSELTGETITEAVIISLAQRLEREKSKQTAVIPLKDELLKIAKRYQALPTLDERPDTEILGYEHGY
ncbi:MAG: type II toxin-antitoxin system VapB family antitoxin [Cyanophyceae cyanobacterium]